LPPPSSVALGKQHHLMFPFPIPQDSNKAGGPVIVVQIVPAKHSVEEKYWASAQLGGMKTVPHHGRDTPDSGDGGFHPRMKYYTL